MNLASAVALMLLAVRVSVMEAVKASAWIVVEHYRSAEASLEFAADLHEAYSAQ